MRKLFWIIKTGSALTLDHYYIIPLQEDFDNTTPLYSCATVMDSHHSFLLILLVMMATNKNPVLKLYIFKEQKKILCLQIDIRF